jgi:hypothetical protein
MKGGAVERRFFVALNAEGAEPTSTFLRDRPIAMLRHQRLLNKTLRGLSL